LGAVCLFATLNSIGCASSSRSSKPPETTASSPGTTSTRHDSPAPGTVAYDKSVFSSLFDNHGTITRSVREIDGGIEATTESGDPAVAALLQDHINAMKDRLETGRRIRQWDPIYVAMFDEGKLIKLDIERTPTGIRVRETSTDPKVVDLIRAHGVVVSSFVREGPEEAGKEHAVPDSAKR